MVSRRILLGGLAAGLAAPVLAHAEGYQETKTPPVWKRKARRTAKALSTQPGDKAALDKALKTVKPLEGAEPETPTAVSGVQVQPAKPIPRISPDEALGRLKQGNAIFARGGASLVLPSAARIGELAAAERPFAVVVACSDSRVAPELLFNCNLGDLFVLRAAGPTVGPEALGAIVYAVDTLGASLVVVLGHTKCGVVGAAVDAATRKTRPTGVFEAMLAPILPAVFDAQGEKAADLHDAAARRNARNIASRLKVADGILAERIAQGRLKIVPATYDLTTAQVAFEA